MRPYLFIPFALAFSALAATGSAQAQLGLDISITAAPPELPVYEQPAMPAQGYIFMPGYWAYGYSGYYWVPGIWVEPPQSGLLWTPGYWSWDAGRYIFNSGYWGPTVGYYGGIDYGFGYGGFGYEGGYWRGSSFYYNRAVNNFGGLRVSNVFERNVTNVTINRYSFNGPNGVRRQPSREELVAARAPHVPPTAMQMQHIQAAQQNRALRASVNHGRPAILATAHSAAVGGAATPSDGQMGQHLGTGQVQRPLPVVRRGSDGSPVPAPMRPAPSRSGPPGSAVQSIMPTHTAGQTASPRPVARGANPHQAPPMPRPSPTREVPDSRTTETPRSTPPRQGIELRDEKPKH